MRVDPDRSALTVSSTAVRADVAAQWWALPAPVRQHLAKRVVVVGAESTGTSTLAEELAAHFGVPCVPEYGRKWTQLRSEEIESPWQSVALDLVAAEQARREDDAARRSPRPLVVCDTDVLATAVGHERHVGSRSPSVEAVARTRVPDLYLLTLDDFPYAVDGMRVGEHLRSFRTGRFREVLAGQAAPWLEVSGSREGRLADGIRAVEEVLASGRGLAPSLEQQQARVAAVAAGEQAPKPVTEPETDAPP